MRISFFVFVLSLYFGLVADAGAREIIHGPVVAQVIKVRDGDSLMVEAHIWPGQVVRVSVRIRGIDAPELRARCDSELQKAIAAKEGLIDFVNGDKVTLHDISGGKYFGRVLARVTAQSGKDAKSFMLASGLARPYRGRKRKSWCDAIADTISG